MAQFNGYFAACSSDYFLLKLASHALTVSLLATSTAIDLPRCATSDFSLSLSLSLLFIHFVKLQFCLFVRPCFAPFHFNI